MSDRSGRPEDESFANVLNGLSFDSGRGRRKRKQEEPDPEVVEARPPHPTPLAGQSSEEDEDHAADVRPYAWTGGRTTSARQLEIESLVSTSDRYRAADPRTPSEFHAIAALCYDPHSVAEVAARLTLPLGVVKVLLGDMAAAGLLDVHLTASTDGAAPGLDLMERILAGLRRL